MKDLGLLVLRVSAGLMMFYGHGMAKLAQIGTEGAASFPDFFGIGGTTSHFLAASAEGVGALCIAIGLFTRGAGFALAFTMGVAAFVAHAADPFFAVPVPSSMPEYQMLLTPFKEFPLLYGATFLSIAIAGGGRYSLDSMVKTRFPKWFQKLICG